MIRLLPATWQDTFLYRYRTVLTVGLGAFVSLFFLVWKLNTLFPGPSLVELEFLNQDLSISELVNDPTNWLYKIFVILVGLVTSDIVLAPRIVSAGLGAISVLLMYTLLRMWYWHRYALIGALMMALSSWFFGFARIATPEIMLIPTVLGLLIILTKLQHEQKPQWLAGLVLLIVSGIYIPGFVYIAAPVVIFQLVHAYKKGYDFSLKKVALPVAGFILGSLLLIIASISNTEVLKEALLIDSIPSIGSLLLGLIYPIRYVFIDSSSDASIHLNNLPMLEIFTTILTLIGLYTFARDRRSMRSKTLLALTVGITLAYTLSQEDVVANILIIPTYILAANGINTLLKQWQESFPYNKLARKGIIVPLLLIALLTVNYHYRRYFVATTNDAATIAAHSEIFTQISISGVSTEFDLYCTQEEQSACQLYARENNATPPQDNLPEELESSVSGLIISEAVFTDLPQKSVDTLSDEEMFTATTIQSDIETQKTLFRVFEKN